MMLRSAPEVDPGFDPLDGERYEICPLCEEGPRILTTNKEGVEGCTDCLAEEEDECPKCGGTRWHKIDCEDEIAFS